MGHFIVEVQFKSHNIRIHLFVPHIFHFYVLTWVCYLKFKYITNAKCFWMQDIQPTITFMWLHFQYARQGNLFLTIPTWCRTVVCSDIFPSDIPQGISWEKGRKSYLWLWALFPEIKLPFSGPRADNMRRATSTFSTPWSERTLKQAKNAVCQDILRKTIFSAL